MSYPITYTSLNNASTFKLCLAMYGEMIKYSIKHSICPVVQFDFNFKQENKIKQELLMPEAP